MRLFNFTNIQSDRKWLRDVLISDTSGSSDDEDKSITDEYFQEMLKQHVQEKKFRKQVHLKSNVSAIFGVRFQNELILYSNNKI